MLRLLIRGSDLRENHSPSSTFNPTRTSMDWEHNMRLCQDLATSTIVTIVTYMKLRPIRRTIGVYSTLVLLQCLYYIIHLAECRSSPDGFLLKDKYIETVVRCLQDMAATGLQIAQHSLNIFKSVISWQNTLSPPSFSSKNTCSLAKPTDAPDSANDFLSNYLQFQLHTNPASIDLYNMLGLTRADL